MLERAFALTALISYDNLTLIRYNNMNSNQDQSTAAAPTNRVAAATRAATAAALGHQSNRENQTSLESHGRDQTTERRQEDGLPGTAAQRRRQTGGI